MGGQKNPGGNAGGGGGEGEGNHKDNDRGSPGPIGGHESYGMDRDTFDKTIGRDRDKGGGGEGKSSPSESTATQDQADFNAVRNAFRRAQTSDAPSTLSDQQGGLTSQYGRFSTPGPIGGASSYGVSRGTFDTMEAPHRATSPERQEAWAKDVLSRGGPQTEGERERLGNLASGRDARQISDFVSGVAGLANPAVGLGTQLASHIANKFATPEFQAGFASVDDGSTASTVSKALGVASRLTGSTGLGTAAQIAGRVSPFADVVESEMGDEGDLYKQIREASGVGELSTRGPEGSRSDVNYAEQTTVQAPTKTTMASRFAAPSTITFGVTDYSQYIQDYMKKILGGGA